MYNTTAESKMKKFFFFFFNYHQELVSGKRGFVLMQALVFFNKKQRDLLRVAAALKPCIPIAQ